MTELLDVLRVERDRKRIEEDRERLPQSLAAFVREAWKELKPLDTYRHGWHIDAITSHLEAVSDGDILRLQIWVPPGTMKSLNVSIFWPVWEWTRRPSLTYYTASYGLKLSWDLCAKSRDLLVSDWFQDRWGDTVHMTKTGVEEYENTMGGKRTATAPGSGGVGKHGHRIILDDLLDASDANATTRAELERTNEWYDSVVFGRAADPKTTAQVIIMQRLHEDDIAAHALRKAEDEWTVLCLPERYESKHPYAWRAPRIHSLVQNRLWETPLRDGDPRQEDDLLWPDHRGPKESAEFARGLTSFKAAGQLQQRPAAREGEILKRDWWRFYDPRIRDKEDWSRLGFRFQKIVISVDTPLKDKESSDNVAIQCWGVKGADRYLLDLKLGKMNYPSAKRSVTEMWRWAHKQFPYCHLQVLIENAGYGVELILDLKRDITGVTKVSPALDGNKVTRAESASDALESGNVFLPGFGPPLHPTYDEDQSPADIVAFVHNCALFPNAMHDDDVDAWSQAMNHIKNQTYQPARWSSALKRRPAVRPPADTGRS